MIKKYWVAGLLVLVFTLQLQAQALNFYFGNIHAHSGYSDGNKDSATSMMSTPLEDFIYARESQHIDFYGISEHNHFSAGMHNVAHYHQGLADANTASIPDTFVAMYGMEWGVIDNGGHVIVYGSDELLGWDNGYYDDFVSEYDYGTLWKKVNERAGAFAYLCHPAVTDYNNIFAATANPLADNAIVGMAARSGPAFSTNYNYSDPTTSNYINRYNDALKRGYHVGVGLDHDTHNSVFGRQTEGRLVVMAPSLTRENIMKAFRQMRFYSSDDWNTKVSFNIASNPMGSIITKAGNPTLSVSVADDDNENITSIAVYYGVPGSGTAPTVLTTANNTSTLSYTHGISNGGSYYYYLKIIQADGDIIWTSPIWYKRNDAITNTPPVAAFSTPTLTVCAGQQVAFADNSTNGPSEWNWYIQGGLPGIADNQNAITTFYYPGQYDVYLVATNSYGSDTSAIQTITVTAPPQLTLTAASNLICLGETDTLTASGADTYHWSTGETTPTIFVTPTSTIYYTVTGTTDGCSATASMSIGVEQCTGIAEASAKTVHIYPNPASNYIMVDMGELEGRKNIQLFDVLGNQVLSQSGYDKLTTIDLSAYAGGSYFLKITTNNSSYITKQFIIRRD